MEKTAALYLTASFIVLPIGTAIGFRLGSHKSGGSLVASSPGSSGGISLASGLPASTDEPVTVEGTIGCLKASDSGPQT